MVSAPFCAKVLAEFGADVIKVEPPEGDAARRAGPFPGGQPHAERSGLFLFANLGKWGVTLDTNEPDGVDRLHRLLADADIFVENQAYPTLAAAGVTAEELRVRHPHLITVSLSPYGRTGDYREYAGYDLQVNALSGMSFGTGHPHREPLTTPDRQAGYLAGLGGAYAAIVALLARETNLAGDSGDAGGQYIDIADSGVISTLLTGYHLPTFIYRGIAGSRSGNRMRLGLFPQLRTALPRRLRVHRRAADGAVPAVPAPAGRPGLDRKATLPGPTRHERPISRGGREPDRALVHGA